MEGLRMPTVSFCAQPSRILTVRHNRIAVGTRKKLKYESKVRSLLTRESFIDKRKDKHLSFQGGYIQWARRLRMPKGVIGS